MNATASKFAIAVVLAATLIFTANYLSRHRSKRLTGPTQVVTCQTTKGPLKIDVYPEWSPRAADRFLQLVDDGFFNHLPLFRCVKDFVCQFGARIPQAGAKVYTPFEDDPQLRKLRKFEAGYLSFAGSGVGSRNTHIFIALAPVKSLGKQPWETPFGVIQPESMAKTVSQFTKEYGDMPPWGQGPDGAQIETPEGEEYLRSRFPKLDWIESCARGDGN